MLENEGYMIEPYTENSVREVIISGERVVHHVHNIRHIHHMIETHELGDVNTIVGEYTEHVLSYGLARIEEQGHSYFASDVHPLAWGRRQIWWKELISATIVSLGLLLLCVLGIVYIPVVGEVIIVVGLVVIACRWSRKELIRYPKVGNYLQKASDILRFIIGLFGSKNHGVTCECCSGRRY